MKILFTFFILLNLLPHCNGQQISGNLIPGDTSQTHILETKRGDRFIGRVSKIENTDIFFLFRNTQELQFELSEIDRIYLPDEIKPETNAARNFRSSSVVVAPTAFQIEAGTIEYQNVSVLWNTVDYGITDHFSMGGGFGLPFLFIARLKGAAVVNEDVQLSIQSLNLIPLVRDSEPLSVFSLSGTYGRTVFECKCELCSDLGVSR